MSGLVVVRVLLSALVLAALADAALEDPPRACRIEVVEEGTRRPVPLVELRTTHDVRFVTDNAGVIAFDAPELMGRETWLHVTADGYEVPADGFGFRGVRMTPEPGATRTIEVRRTSIAMRLGRLTGAGLFAESQKLGRERDAKESGVLGCDSVQTAVHRGRMFWAFGDTTLARYPLGIFHMIAATSDVRPLASFEPPLRFALDFHRDDAGLPRAIAEMPGKGPTWLTGFASVAAADGGHRLVASYVKVEPPMDVYECGLCVFDDERARFEHLRTLWTRSESAPKPPPYPKGHAVFVDERGRASTNGGWVLFGDPFPALRVPATFEAWQDASSWETLTPQTALVSASDGTKVEPHSGSIAWNPFRGRWVTVFLQWFGAPSAFGELWYAEADAPTGPWGKAVKVLGHANSSFYNPRLHPEFTPDDSPVLLFEGTFARTFSSRQEAVPRYDYNQILYRIDLDDERLAPAREAAQ